MQKLTLRDKTSAWVTQNVHRGTNQGLEIYKNIRWGTKQGLELHNTYVVGQSKG